jgi:hypothetical protein
MKRNGLRALGLAACAVVLVSLIGFAVVDLYDIVANEPVPEISKAAGFNLVDDYINTYTVEELTDLAANGATPGIRLAADRALFKLNGGLLTLVVLDQDTLYAMAAAGDQDAADAWVFNARAAYKRPNIVEEAIAASEVETIEIALGRLLGGFYVVGSPIGEKPKDELLRLVVVGDTLGVRVAAATALTSYWIQESVLAIPQVERAIRANSGVNPELALAHQDLLAYLYGLE